MGKLPEGCRTTSIDESPDEQGLVDVSSMLILVSRKAMRSSNCIGLIDRGCKSPM